MGITKILAPVLLCATVVAAAGNAVADPAPAPAPEPQPALQVKGTDHNVAYQVALSDDKRSAVSTLQTGRFIASWDGDAVVVTDDNGILVGTVPLKYDIGGKTLEVTPKIEDDNRKLTLTPVAESATPLRDIDAQQQFFDVVQANMPAVATGAVIGGAIGFILGFPAGLFVLDFITAPLMGIAGALIGGAIGLQASGGQPAIEAALQYANTIVPNASQALAPAFGVPQPDPSTN